MSANLMSLARSGGKFLKLFGDRKMMKTMPTARDYVQYGLIAMWDGIENAGWGKHDPSATVWKDLVGTRDLKSSEVGCNYTIYSAGNDNLSQFLKYDGDITLCARVEFVGVSWQDWCYFGLGTDVGTSKGLAIAGNNAFRVRVQDGYYSPSWSVDVVIPNATAGKAYSIAIVFHFATKSFDVYSDGVYISSADVPNWNIDPDVYQVFSFGARYDNRRCGKRFNGFVYSRALTSAEISHNYATDKARFNLPD